VTAAPVMIELGEVMATKSGSVDPSKFSHEAFDLYSIPAFDRGEPDIAIGADIGSAKQIVEPGDVLLSKIVPHIRRSWVVGPNRGRRLIASGEWIVFRSARLHPPFLRHVLVGNPFHAQFMRTVSGVGGSLLRARPSHVADIRVPLPPLPEQRRIAEILDKADALRAKRRAALAQLDTLTQSIFLDMFGDPIRNPSGFPVRPMIELIDPQRPISYGILMPGPDQADGVQYVRVVDMKNGGIELSGIRKTTKAMSNSFRRSLLRPGDLLMSIRGHVGRFAVVPPELDGANITQDTARLAIVGASSIFVRECLRTEAFQRWMARHTKGVAVRGINLGDVKLMPIILPPRQVQEEFARQAGVAAKLKIAERASQSEMDSLFASLQHRAFTGDLTRSDNGAIALAETAEPC
jgi:type I restriction enzyme, S subunit